MADATPKAPASASDTVKDILDRYKRAEERERDNMLAAYEDLEFYAGTQWPDDQAKRLEDEGRPALTLNQLPTFVRQVTNDIRMMRPAIKVVPVDSNGDPKTADVIGGMIRYVENRSDAQAAYFDGMDSQVVAGIGHWQVTTEYASERTFDQELRIIPVDDGVAVLWDPDSSLPTREDAMWCFQPVDLTRDAFKSRYPKASADPLESDKPPEGWVSEDHVRIARYWCKKPVKRTLALLSDGSVIELDTPEKMAEVDQANAILAQQGKPPVRVEERDGFKVTHCVVSATAVLEEEQDWLGRYIPIVPVFGEQVRIGRKVLRRGIIRFAKDAQRMFNYAQSAQVEAIAFQTKAPWLVTDKNVQAYAAEWAEANNKPLPYLRWTPDGGNNGAPPQRMSPPIASQGMAELIAQAGQTMKDVTGIQNAGLGKQSNETSGKAINARQREGDVGMFTYVDNFARAIRHTGTILIDLIPRVYDTQRMIRVMGEDGTVDLVPINTPQPDPAGGMGKVANDLSVGAYDVVVQSGPGYSTKREEAKEGMIALLQAVPDVFPLIGDLIAKSQDWPLSDAIAARLKATIPPNIIAAEEAAKSGEPAQPPPPEPPGPAEIEAKAKADKAVADAKKADTEYQIKDLELGAMMAEGVLGPDPGEAMPAGPAPAPGQQPAPAMPQAA